MLKDEAHGGRGLFINDVLLVLVGGQAQRTATVDSLSFQCAFAHTAAHLLCQLCGVVFGKGLHQTFNDNASAPSTLLRRHKESLCRCPADASCTQHCRTGCGRSGLFSSRSPYQTRPCRRRSSSVGTRRGRRSYRRYAGQCIRERWSGRGAWRNSRSHGVALRCSVLSARCRRSSGSSNKAVATLDFFLLIYSISFQNALFFQTEGWGIIFLRTKKPTGYGSGGLFLFAWWSAVTLQPLVGSAFKN